MSEEKRTHFITRYDTYSKHCADCCVAGCEVADLTEELRVLERGRDLDPPRGYVPEHGPRKGATAGERRREVVAAWKEHCCVGEEELRQKLHVARREALEAEWDRAAFWGDEICNGLSTLTEMAERIAVALEVG